VQGSPGKGRKVTEPANTSLDFSSQGGGQSVPVQSSQVVAHSRTSLRQAHLWSPSRVSHIHVCYPMASNITCLSILDPSWKWRKRLRLTILSITSSCQTDNHLVFSVSNTVNEVGDRGIDMDMGVALTFENLINEARLCVTTCRLPARSRLGHWQRRASRLLTNKCKQTTFENFERVV